MTLTDIIPHFFHINGEPIDLSYDKMRHLHPIYNSTSRKILLKFARQCHKSTFDSIKLMLPCILYPGYHSLYTAPSLKQVSKFSTEKIENCYESPIVQEHYVGPINQIGFKELKNGSKLYLETSGNIDTIRGASTDQVAVDEVQDVVSDDIAVIEQSMSNSLNKYKNLVQKIPNLPKHFFRSTIYSGTPKNAENTMERIWKNSTQNEWIIHCKHCNKFNYINATNIGKICLICNKCGNPIFYEHGQWITMNSGATIDGYRLPQIVLPWINDPSDPDAWLINITNEIKNYNEEKIFNEILALPYQSSKYPISEANIKSCCKDYDMLTIETIKRNKKLENAAITAGIDWGKGETENTNGISFSVLWINAFYENKDHCIFARKYKGKLSDLEIQVEDMCKTINRFDVEFTIADAGWGADADARMAAKLGVKRFAEIMENGNLKQRIRWDSDKGHYIFNRTRMMNEMIDELKNDVIEFFRYEQFKDEFESDFTGIYKTYSERTRQVIYDHIVPDDAFHAFMYSIIARKIRKGVYSKYLL